MVFIKCVFKVTRKVSLLEALLDKLNIFAKNAINIPSVKPEAMAVLAPYIRLAELMGNQGSVVATDRSERRCKTLRQNLDRLGVSIAQIAVVDWGSGAPDLEPFDAILLDVPCSNTGVLRRRVDVRWRLYQNFTDHIRAQQLAILAATSPLVKPGGSIVYSTCSIEPEENSELVAAFLSEHPEFRLEASMDSLPYRDQQDGAYAARLRRLTSSVPLPMVPASCSALPPSSSPS